jgi:hypothetical protein
MTRGGVFENGQEGIIAIDIQDGYDKFNDNVKILDSSQDLNITITKMSLLLIMKVKRKLRVMDCLKRFVAQPDLTEIGKTGNSLMLDRLGAFRCILQQLTYSNGGLMKSGLILKSNANYLQN